ncbi:MAG TPA: hypothetical protein VMS17_25865 [Gemmataceae bacterium]|nr:hypothetical protein [Gemmataceae bacterium]
MRRIHFIEIGDQPWCPRGIRRGVTDYCRFVQQHSGYFNPVAPLLADAIKKSGARRVLDMGSGAAGPWLGLLPKLRRLGVDVPVCLSDYDPNVESLEWAQKRSQGALTYHPAPVDATQVPAELTGLRTMFSAFHHLRPDQARAALADAAAKRQPIAVFDGARVSPFLAPFLLTTLVRVLLVTPFILPFRWSRLFWTYIIPALSFVLTFDVIVSMLRMYSVNDMRELTAGLDDYHWDIGTMWAWPIPVRLTYLIGMAKEGSG